MKSNNLELCQPGDHDFEDKLIELPKPKPKEKRWFPNVTHWRRVCIVCGTIEKREV